MSSLQFCLGKIRRSIRFYSFFVQTLKSLYLYSLHAIGSFFCISNDVNQLKRSENIAACIHRVFFRNSSRPTCNTKAIVNWGRVAMGVREKKVYE